LPWFRLVVCFVVILFLFESVAWAETIDPDLTKKGDQEELVSASEVWSESATRIVKWVEKKNYIEARNELAKLAHNFSTANLANKNLSVAGIKALSDVILNLEGQLNRITPDEKQIYRSAVQLQIAFDAIFHPHQPLWKQYYSTLKKDIKAIQIALGKKKELSVIKEEVKQLYQDYQMVRPALIIVKSPYVIEKVDSLLTFIRQAMEMEPIASGVQELETMLYPIFFGTEKDVIAVMDPFGSISFYFMVFSIIGFITLVLVYVAWNKYKGLGDAGSGR
jgi:sporulation protein YpjB